MRACRNKICGGFTLVELLAAMVVLALLMTVIFGIFNQASKAWTLAENRTENFQGARAALDTMCRELESAMVGIHTNSNGTMNRLTVVTFEDSGNATVLNSFGAASSPAFSTLYTSLSATPPNDAIFFVTQAPDSMGSGSYIDLAESGYYVAFSTAATSNGGVPRGYYALMRHYTRTAPPGAWDVFSNPGSASGGWWATGGIGGLDSSNSVPLLDNVIRFEVRYEYGNIGSGVTNGTSSVENWNAYGGNGPSTTEVPDPTVQLPRAFHLRLSVMDRRYAARLSALCSGNGGALDATEMGNVPYSLNSILPPAKAATLKEGLRTFFRTVYPRGAK